MISILPYEIKGRWHRIFLESDGSTVQITDTDIPCEIAGNYIKFAEGIHIVDRRYDINSIEHEGNVVIAADLYGYADGCQGIYCPAAKAFDYAYIYVLTHLE